MKHNFEMIVHKLSEDLDSINIYPLGDVHIGSRDFDYVLWNRWKKMVMDDPKGYVVIIGDLTDNGLKTSKTNSYQATMSPWEQKMWMTKELEPLVDKILGGTRGNHEERSVYTSDSCPMYDVFAKLDIEDLYREDMAFLKVSLGKKNSERQWSYGIVLAHGASRGKTDKFSYVIDGMDLFVTGHIHQPSVTFPSKLVMDVRNDVVLERTMMHVVVPSFLKTGGYGLRALYVPQGHKIPIVKLYGTQKEMEIKWV